MTVSVVAPAVGSVGDDGTGFDRPATDPSADGADASGTASSAGVAQPADAMANFPDPPALDVARGDVAAIPLKIARGERADVTIRSADGEFNVTLDYSNRDEKRRAILYLNTYLAGQESGVASGAYLAGDDDRVAVSERGAAPGSPLPTGTYEVQITGESTDRTVTMNVTESEVGDLTMLRAPEDELSNLTSDRAIRNRRAAGVVTEPPTGDAGPEPAFGDTVVYRLDAGGVFGLMAARDGDTAEDEFLDVVEADDGAFEFSITGPDGEATTVDLRASASNGTLHVAPDPDNETLYVVTNLRDAAADANASSFVDPGRAEYAFADGTHLGAAGDARALDYEVRERALSYDPAESVLYRDAAANQSIGGETTLAPGTELTLVLDEIDGRYDRRFETTVTADGGLDAEVALSDAPETGRFALTTAEIEDTRTMLVTGNATDAVVWFTEHEDESPVDEVGGAQVALGRGGFVVAYEVPPDEEIEADNRIGHTEYLEPGVHEPTIPLDRAFENSENVVLVVHRDTDGNEAFDYPATDDPYRIGGEAVYGEGRVLVEGDTVTPSQTVQYLSVDLRYSDDQSSITTPAGNLTGTATATATETATETQTRTQTTTAPPTTAPTTTAADETETAEPTSTTIPLPTTRPPATANGTATDPAAATETQTGTASAGDDGAGFGALLAVLAVALSALVGVRGR